MLLGFANLFSGSLRFVALLQLHLSVSSFQYLLSSRFPLKHLTNMHDIIITLRLNTKTVYETYMNVTTISADALQMYLI